MQLNLTYQVPFTESLEGTNFIIQGVAINETTTSNNHKFLSEELIPAASTLTGVPLLVDHENKVENIKGRVMLGSYNELGKRVDFKAMVMDETCKAMIRDGRLNSVSVGAMVRDVEEIDGELIPRGITFNELSLVAVPADSGATFSIAMKEAYSASKQLDVSSTSKLPVVSALQVEPVATVETANIKEEIPEDEEKEDDSQQNTEGAGNPVKDAPADNTIVLQGGLENMSEIETVKVDESAALKEMIATLAKKVEELSKPKVAEVLRNEFEEADTVVEKDYKIVQGNKSFSYIANSY